MRSRRSTPAEMQRAEEAVLDMIRVGSFFGRQPSVREMASWLGYFGGSGFKMVPVILGRLEAKGLIRRGSAGKNAPGKRSRAIELVGPRPGRRPAQGPPSGTVR